MKIKRYHGVSVVGSCQTCGKPFEDYRKPRQAYYHAKKTGHKVIVEIGTSIHYN